MHNIKISLFMKNKERVDRKKDEEKEAILKLKDQEDYRSYKNKMNNENVKNIIENSKLIEKDKKEI